MIKVGSVFTCQLDQSFKACSGSAFAGQMSEVTRSNTVSSAVSPPQGLSWLTPAEMFFRGKNWLALCTR